MATPAGAPPFPWADPAALERHVLTFGAGIGADEVEALALSRFVAAAWESAPEEAHGGWGRRSAATPGVLRLSRHSRLIGPYALEPGDAVQLGVPASAVSAYLVDAPRERGEAPYPGGDRDGIKRAFPDATPVRDEERVVRWLVSAARRVGGAVRIAGSGAVLVPDPQASIDLTVFTDVWLEPQAALAVLQRVAPQARLAMGAVPWAGPPPGTGEDDAPGTTDLPARVRRNLHAEADAYDVAALSRPDELDGYGALVDLGIDGLIAVEAGGEQALPLALAGLPWAAGGAVTYRVLWAAPDFLELELERPSLAHRVARSRAQPLVSALARELHRAVGGEVLDAAEFLINPADL
ncbi:hypothetical protein [Pengzhenrongella sicca]|uniref:Uncharacterized protein n=1 Tax=Pengzhenrongella sicca TaxID=2819238 RepID=A0A8A4ZEK7_9MICO|nr:hypothetical protein [Pengzhenrongella sicca]QTE29343.1 hypothetical protein J4E96_19065 [Pengzhenrongella sicca]